MDTSLININENSWFWWCKLLDQDLKHDDYVSYGAFCDTMVVRGEVKGYSHGEGTHDILLYGVISLSVGVFLHQLDITLNHLFN